MIEVVVDDQQLKDTYRLTFESVLEAPEDNYARYDKWVIANLLSSELILSDKFTELRTLSTGNIEQAYLGDAVFDNCSTYDETRRLYMSRNNERSGRSSHHSSEVINTHKGVYSLYRLPSPNVILGDRMKCVKRHKYAENLQNIPNNVLKGQELIDLLKHNSNELVRIKAMCNAILPLNFESIDLSPESILDGDLSKGCSSKELLFLLSNIKEPLVLFQFIGTMLRFINAQDDYLVNQEDFDSEYRKSRVDVAKIAMYIFAPLADLMGLPEIYRALIDSSLQVLSPELYEAGIQQRDEELAVLIAPLVDKVIPVGKRSSLNVAQKVTYLGLFFKDFFVTRFNPEDLLLWRTKSVFSYLRKKRDVKQRNFDDLFAMRFINNILGGGEIPTIQESLYSLVNDLKRLDYLANMHDSQAQTLSERDSISSYIVNRLDILFGINGLTFNRTGIISNWGIHDLVKLLKEEVRRLDLKETNETLYQCVTELIGELEEDYVLTFKRQKGILAMNIAEKVYELANLWKMDNIRIESLEVEFYDSRYHLLEARDSGVIRDDLQGDHFDKSSPYQATHATIHDVEISFMHYYQAQRYAAAHYRYKHGDTSEYVEPAARLSMLTVELAKAQVGKIGNLVTMIKPEYDQMQRIYALLPV